MSKPHRWNEYRFTGQNPSEWPPWLVFMNYATDEHRTIIILHYLEGPVTIKRGDLIVRLTDGRVLPESALPSETEILHPEAKPDK